MNINWDLVYFVLSILAGMVLVIWVLIGVWFWRTFTKHERRVKERRQKLHNQRNSRRENW